jgi:ATP-dependent helicase/nuclease subunit B
MFLDPGPRVFALPPGADFAASLVQGLRARMANAPPEAMARVTIYLNSSRMRRRVTDGFIAAGAGFLPRLRLVTDLASALAPTGLPIAVSALRRRLELAQLVEGLLRVQPDLAPRSALFDLADSLASLLDEMQGEGVSPSKIADLNVADHSAHWARTQAFMAIVAPLFNTQTAPDTQGLQRILMDRLASTWQIKPPTDPVIVAGSTGSRGITSALMQAVAQLPQGALILPGFDFAQPASVWSGLSDALTAEDHPQYRFHKLLNALGLQADAVQSWIDTGPNTARNALISLSLRPAPVTDQWLTEGQHLPDLRHTTAALTLVEAPTARAEAMAIAVMLRHAAQGGKTVALISPDRGLTRQVIAALDRWGIVPDDSAGRPLALSAPGRLLRHVVRMFGERLSAEALLVLLKHPLTATGAARGPHLRLTRELELKLRRHGPAFPVSADLLHWGAAHKDPAALPWAQWLGATLGLAEKPNPRALSDHVADHIALAEALACGPADIHSSGALWLEAAGEAARTVIDELLREAQHGGSMTDADYRDLFEAILNRGEVREAVQAHPRILILGPREAREQGADLVILGGLNDGVWPQLPAPDPWMNRQMRLAAGLLLPERQIGLSAHDYQQAVAAPEVILTRAIRNAEAETVPSRWINRLTNLMEGLPARGGPEALAAMRLRGRDWLALTEMAEDPGPAVENAKRPAPRPPTAARPQKLAVTGIKTLIRDPYAIYARHILRLYKLNPLRPSPDALLRGSVLHLVLERFTRNRPEAESREMARERLLTEAQTVLQTEVPWPAARALWLSRLNRAADFFLTVEATLGGTPMVIEEQGRADLTGLGFALTAKPDRIDALPDGRVHIFDYKTGTPPTDTQQKLFDKQLLLEAAMVTRGAFTALDGPRDVAGITYIGLGSKPKAQTSAPDEAMLGKVWEELHVLITEYLSPTRGYAARRAMFGQRFPGDYDHLARFGEWEMTDMPVPEDVG